MTKNINNKCISWTIRRWTTW